MSKTKAMLDFVSHATGLTITSVESCISAYLKGVSQELTRGNRVRLPGIGSFTVLQRAAAPARNPRTGERILVASHKVVRFKATKALLIMLNGQKTAATTSLWDSPVVAAPPEIPGRAISIYQIPPKDRRNDT